MRLGSKKRICIRSNRVNKKKISVILCLILFCLILISGILYFFNTVKPIMIQLATSKAQGIAIEAVNQAVLEIFRQETVDYSDIVMIDKDSEGKIRAVQSNLAGMNALKADIALRIQEKTAALSEAELEFPLGSLSGQEVFSGMGPRVRVKLMPYGETQTQFESFFEAAGINQTRLTIQLHVKTNLALLMPFSNSACEIEDTIPVLQTIIVGEIPESYLNIDHEDESVKEDILDLAPGL